MASTARIDELKKKFDENPRRYFAPLANEFRKAGDIEQAIIICEEFLPQQPGHMSGHIVYGQALFEVGKLPESRAVFETALGLDPENLIALRHLGDIARDQGDHPAARGWYARVLDADPRNEEIQAVIAGLDSPAGSAAADTVIIEAPSPFGPPPLPTVDIPRAAAEPLDLESFGAPPPIPEDPSLADTHPLGVPVIPWEPLYTPSTSATAIIEGFSAHSFEKEQETASLVSSEPHMAEGLESTAFIAPEEPVASAEDLDSSLESGVPSFSAPEGPIATLDGFEGSGGAAHDDVAEHGALPPLDLDDGLVLPPQGDPLAESALDAHAEPETSREQDTDEMPEFDMPSEASPVVAGAFVDDAAELESPEEETYESIPVELPPAVIAAEAELIEAGETPAPSPASDIEMELEEAPASQPPFVTETMAELYLAQGHRDRARDVYAQLADANPSDARLRALADSVAPADAVAPAGPTARDFFARLAARRPGSRAAAVAPPAADDFAPIEPETAESEAPAEVPFSVAEADADEHEALTQPALENVSSTARAMDEPTAEPPVQSLLEVDTAAPQEPEPVAPALERAAKMRTPNGSIDALFGNRVPGTSEDSAAAALAQAFGGVTEGPLPTIGRPAHAATGELSLDSVFRDGPSRPPRPSQSFSFDQFFTGSAAGASERTAGGAAQRRSSELAAQGEPPAEKSADDIEQFNSWLQGLKPR